MKVKIFKQERVETEVYINFPIYRSQILDNSCIFMKVESVDRQITIQVYDDETKVEVEIETPSFYGSIKYLLGHGEYQSSEEDFIGALNKAKSLISNI